MTAQIQTILIIGGTSGLGEAFARRFYALGKQVIVTGRRSDRLTALAKDLPGLETYDWDITDFATHGAVTQAVLAKHPKLDTVLLMSGIQKQFTFTDPQTSTPETIESEIATNLTSPALLTRLFLPHLIALSTENHLPTHLILVSSGLAFIPLGLYPVYEATKAAIHALAVGLRQQVSRAGAGSSPINILELAPPYVDTALDAEHRQRIVEMSGGEEKAMKPTPLDEYMDQTMTQFEGAGTGTKEITYGFSQMAVDAWRRGVGAAMGGMGIDA